MTVRSKAPPNRARAMIGNAALAAFAMLVASVGFIVLADPALRHGTRHPTTLDNSPDKSEAQRVDSLARQHVRDARYDLAASHFEDAADRYARVRDWRSQVRATLDAGSSRREAGDYQLGLDAVDVADSLRRALVPDDRELEIRTRRQRGITLIRLSRLSESIAELEAAMKQATALGEPLLLAEAQQSLGWAFQEANRSEDALEHFRASLLTLETNGVDAPAQQARALNSIGIHYYSLNRADSAITYYTRASNIRRELHGPDHPAYATSLANLALAHHLGGDRSLTIPYYARATEIFAQHLGEDHPEVARCFTNLGLFYREDGKLEMALMALDRSLSMRKRLLGEDHINLSHTYLLLASVSMDKGEYERAADFSREALRVLGVNAPTPGSTTTEALLALGQSVEALGDHDEADSAYVGALAALDVSASENGLARAAIGFFRARNHSRRGEDVEAMIVLGDSCGELREVLSFMRTSYYDCLNLRARILVGLGESARSTAILESVIDELGTARNDSPAQNLRSIADAYGIQARIHRERFERSGDDASLAAAMTSLERSHRAAALLQERHLSKESKRAVLRESTTTADSLISTGLALYRRLGEARFLETAFRAAEWRRTAVLIDVLESLDIDEQTWIPSHVAAREAELRLAILAESRNVRTERVVPGLSLVELAHQHETVLREIETAYPEYPSLSNAYLNSRVDDLMDVIRDDEVVVEYAMMAEHTYSFVLTPDSILLGGRWPSSTINAKASALRQAIARHDYRGFVESARTLYRLLLEPVEEHIRGKHLIVVPDGLLQFIPFEALLTTDIPADTSLLSYRTLPYLVQTNAVSYAYSAALMRELRTRRRDPPPMDFLGLAPVFSRSGTHGSVGRVLMVQNAQSSPGSLRSLHLPASLDEVKVIRKAFDRSAARSTRGRSFWDTRRRRTTLLLHNNATERAFKKLDLSAYRFIHLATHAFASEEDPDRSGLVLAEDEHALEDGVLQVREVYDLELRSELVVLSACETGLGRISTGDGIIGLTSGFLYAGASNVMVSLWKADDATTRDLMISFYEILLGGRTKAEALRQAKLMLIDRSPVHARPFYWAQFVVIGE